MMLPLVLLLGVSTNIVQLKYLLVKIDINVNTVNNESVPQKSMFRSLVVPAEKASGRT